MILNFIFKGISVSDSDSFFYESYEPEDCSVQCEFLQSLA